MVYTDFLVSTCLKHRWHLLDRVRCAQMAHMVHYKWPYHLEMLKLQFFLCFPRAVSVERSQSPHPVQQTYIRPLKPSSLCSVMGKKKMVNKTWFNIHGMLHRGDKDKQITEGVHRYRMLWEPREESRNLSCVIRGGLPEEVVPDWNLKR